MRWLPAAYVAAVLLLEPVTPVEWPVSFLLIALPVVAAFTYGPVCVAAIAVFSVAFEGVLAGTTCCAGRDAHALFERHYVGGPTSRPPWSASSVPPWPPTAPGRRPAWCTPARSPRR
ncbi:hypothetical protein GCM10020000_02330 [Streptomyces olivoverticillatus]